MISSLTTSLSSVARVQCCSRLLDRLAMLVAAHTFTLIWDQAATMSGSLSLASKLINVALATRRRYHLLECPKARTFVARKIIYRCISAGFFDLGPCCSLSVFETTLWIFFLHCSRCHLIQCTTPGHRHVDALSGGAKPRWLRSRLL